jgi:predicted ATPase
LTAAVLRQCADIAWLVTSRERLGVPGEVTYRVPSLSMPEAGRDTSAQRLVEYESVRLFRERAWLHLPHFEVTDLNAPALASICRRLDGIPLAIELAAARTRSMSIDELDRRLDRSLALLAGGSRTLPRRQQTLRAAIDWSFDLLSDAEKALFRRMAVFAGGLSLEAAERVCAGDGIETRDVLDLLASLADKSLVLVDERATSTRYRLLETVHEYAGLRLREGDDEASWFRRHLAYFLALAEEAEPQLTGKDQQAWLDRLESEHDNVRAALARSCAAGADASAGLRLASAVSRFWLVRGYLTEGRGWLSQLLAASAGGDNAARAKALNWAGALAWKQGDYAAARTLYEQSLALRRELGDRGGVGAVLSNLGLLAYEQGDYARARALHEESLAIDRESGDRWGVAVSLIHLASLASAQGDHASARPLYEESLAMFRAIGDRGHIANALRGLAALCSQQGDDAAARALFEESLAICRDLRDRAGVARALYGLGVAARHGGDHAAAQAMHEESLAIFRDLGDREAIADSLHNLAEVAVACSDYPRAKALEEESLAICRVLGDRRGIAASVEGLAAVACATGEPRRAASLWGAMQRLREEIGAPLVAGERRGYERKVAAGRSALRDDAAFERAWQEGRAMALERAIAYALERDGA